MYQFSSGYGRRQRGGGVDKTADDGASRQNGIYDRSRDDMMEEVDEEETRGNEMDCVLCNVIVSGR